MLTTVNHKEYIPLTTSHEVVGIGVLSVAASSRKVLSNAAFLRLVFPSMGGLGGELQNSQVPHLYANPSSSVHPIGVGCSVKRTMRRNTMQSAIATTYQKTTIKRALRILESSFTRENCNPFENPSDIKNYLRLKFSDLQHEEFYAIWMDSQNKIISIEKLASGSIRECHIYPREIVKSAIKHNAASVAFFHNHPSGNSSPSIADIALTIELKRILSIIETQVLDHLIIGIDSVVSLAERGLI